MFCFMAALHVPCFVSPSCAFAHLTRSTAPILCRQYEENTCNRGGYCNFMHLKPIGKDLRKRLFGRYKTRSRSRSPEK